MIQQQLLLAQRQQLLSRQQQHLPHEQQLLPFQTSPQSIWAQLEENLQLSDELNDFRFPDSREPCSQHPTHSVLFAGQEPLPQSMMASARRLTYGKLLCWQKLCESAYLSRLQVRLRVSCTLAVPQFCPLHNVSASTGTTLYQGANSSGLHQMDSVQCHGGKHAAESGAPKLCSLE